MKLRYHFFQGGSGGCPIGHSGHDLAQVLNAHVSRCVDTVQICLLVMICEQIPMGILFYFRSDPICIRHIPSKYKDTEARVVPRFMDPLFLCPVIPESGVGDYILAAHLQKLCLKEYFYIPIVFQLVRNHFGTGKFIFPHNYGNFFRIFGQKNPFLHSGKSAADHKDMKAGEKFPVTGSAVSNASALKLSLSFESQLARIRAGCQNHTKGSVFPFCGAENLDITRKLHGKHFSSGELCAEILSLAAHILCQLFSACFYNTRIIYNLRGYGDLASDLRFFQN